MIPHNNETKDVFTSKYAFQPYNALKSVSNRLRKFRCKESNDILTRMSSYGKREPHIGEREGVGSPFIR